jgi:HTH-type transcriptional regulator/antitoxin HigA
MTDLTPNRYVPDSVSPPGETLLEAIQDRGLSQADLARRMGRPHKTINEIIQGKAAITPDTAIQLEHVLDIPAHFWGNRQQQFDQHVARVRETERLAGYTEWSKRFPVAAMARCGWINSHTRTVDQTAELLKFFGVASPSQWTELSARMAASFRQSKTHPSELEHISAWLRQGELVASRLSLPAFDRDAFRALLVSSIRGLTREAPAVFQTSLPGMCAQVGVAVAFVPELPKARVSGATRWLAPDRALIQLSLRYKTDDHLWFTFFHEAGHIIEHGKRDIFLETPGEAEDGHQETEADAFAADTLIPPDALDAFLASIPAGRFPSKSAIASFAESIGIAPGIVVGRLQHDRLPSDSPLPYSHYNDLKRHFEWTTGHDRVPAA